MSKDVGKEMMGMTPKATGKTLPQLLNDMKPQILAALPKHMNGDRVLRLVLTAFRNNPKLEECRVDTIMGSIVTLSQLGLEIGVGGQAFLVPYWDTRKNCRVCQPIPGWMGQAALLARSGLGTAWTGAVFDGDFFEWEKGTRPYITHRDNPDFRPDAQLLHSYGVGYIGDSKWPIIEVWPNGKLLAHRDRHNQVGDSHYSYKNWEMYCRKIPFLQVVKYLPRSAELQQAIDLDVAAEKGVTIDYESAMSGSWLDQVEKPQGTPPEDGGDAGADQSASNAPPRRDGPSRAARKQPEKQAAPPAERPAAESPAAEQQQASATPFSFEDVVQAITDAKSEEDLVQAEDLIRSIDGDGNKSALTTMATNKRARIAKAAAPSAPPNGQKKPPAANKPLTME